MATQFVGKPVARVDGPAKVTGRARYAAEFNQPSQAYAVIVHATVGLGHIRTINADAVRKLPGVLAVISHFNAPRLAYHPHKAPIDPAVGERLHVFQDNQVRFFGQPVAVVVADTLDDAERAAASVQISYESRQPMLDISGANVAERAPDVRGHSTDHLRGDADSAFQLAPVKVDLRFSIARENHNPIEPHATVATWRGDRLTLWSKSQFVVNEQAEIAAIFGLPRQNVQVICPFIGGAFGTSLRTWPHVTVAVIAARHVRRPVKLVLTRGQMSFMTGHRPHEIQRMALGATSDGRLVSVIHEARGETSRYEEFVEALTSATTYMYASPNMRTSYRLVPTDTATPTYMRGPGESSGMFAMECALDQLASTLEMDPVELRRRNEPSRDESVDKPFSSRSLLQCYDIGAAQFGWSRRNPKPRSMRDGRLLIGWGVASATYPVLHSPASARVRILGDGTAEVEAAASDMGPGTYTSMTQVAAEYLGLPIEQVRFTLGRSDFPPTPPHGGSQTMASVGMAIHDACREVQRQAALREAANPRSPFFRAPFDAMDWDGAYLRKAGATSSNISYREIVASSGGKPLEATATARRAAEANAYSMHAFGAIFAEVAVDPDVGIVRVRRMVGAYGAGRIVNPRLARSQCVGGMIGGIGMALMERTVLDSRNGRPMNAHMAEYLLPVNLDIPQIDVHFVDEADPHVNPLGVKGLGEISLVGVAPAIANAIYHATGHRFHALPIGIENILDAERH